MVTEDVSVEALQMYEKWRSSGGAGGSAQINPIRFEKDLKVTIQALGWRTHRDRQYLPLQDDIASVVFWYQTLPTAQFPTLPDRDYLEVI